MRITSISLTNFRAFSYTQKIEIAPVTMLFGPNSAGKSSILMALAYVQQILTKGHCDPNRLDALGDRAIGGFRALVHRNDFSKRIKIRISYEGNTGIWSLYSNNTTGLSNVTQHGSRLILDDIGMNTNNGELEFEIAWSNKRKEAYVRNYRVWANGQYLGGIHSDEGGKTPFIDELNTAHPLLLNYEEDIDSEDGYSEFASVLNGLNPNRAVPAKVIDPEQTDVHFENYISPVSISCDNGALPRRGRPVLTDLTGQELGDDDLDEHFDYLVVEQALSQIFVLPLDLLQHALEQSLQIGPLRKVPHPDFVANPNPEQADWFDGTAAWDILHRDPNTDSEAKKLLDKTSRAFSQVDALNTGYSVINASITDGLGAGMFASNNSFPAALLEKRHIFFIEESSGIKLSAVQLGTGISQVLPIVVAANLDQPRLIAIEQPELHIHPRLQTAIADVIIESRQKHRFLIETHSEHFILRILKRIRQTTDGELPENFEGISADEVVINYLEPNTDGVVVRRIRIDKDGEFIDRWPHGFFEERREELM